MTDTNSLNHPLVGDYQMLTYSALYLLFYNTPTGLYVQWLLWLASIDAQFWTFIFGPVLYIILPGLIVYLLFDYNLRMTMDNYFVLRYLKRWADAGTFWFWYYSWMFGVELVDDKNIPALLAFWWVVLPINYVLSFWTILFFPLTIYAIYQTYQLD